MRAFEVLDKKVVVVSTVLLRISFEGLSLPYSYKKDHYISIIICINIPCCSQRGLI